MMNDKIKLLGLKAKICGQQHVSSKLASKAARLTGAERHKVQLVKRDFGQETRMHLIAYGLLRGMAYKNIENKCGIGNTPNPHRVLEIIHDGLFVFQKQRKEWDLARVVEALAEDHNK